MTHQTPRTWIWQATDHHTVPVTAERAYRLQRAGETVWPAGHEDGSHLLTPDTKSDNDAT
jgi:hypothetical protein